jgi:glycerophosphoryl diester phosphodiesterase
MARKVISHRARLDGERNGIPGNTLQAFTVLLDTVAIQFPGVDIDIETDVRLTWGGLLPVAHDNLLQVSTSGSGFMNRVMTHEELATLRVKCAGKITAYGVPELEDVLRLLQARGWRGRLHLELKHGPGDPPGVLEAVLEVLERYPDLEVWISSFDHKILRKVPKQRPVGVLTNTMPTEGMADYLQKYTADGERSYDRLSFNPDVWNLPDEVVADARQLVEVNAYTVPPDFAWAHANGVNLITDEPLAALQWLTQAA